MSSSSRPPIAETCIQLFASQPKIRNLAEYLHSLKVTPDLLIKLNIKDFTEFALTRPLDFYGTEEEKRIAWNCLTEEIEKRAKLGLLTPKPSEQKVSTTCSQLFASVPELASMPSIRDDDIPFLE
jgi:hypothetical protein